jgi:hypothetical protein
MYAVRPGRRGLGYVGTCPTGQTWNSSASVCVAPGETVVAPDGTPVAATYQDALDCSNAKGTAWGALVAALAPKCYGYSPAAWAQMAVYVPSSLDTSPVAPAAIPAAYSATAPTVDEAAQQTTDSLNAAALATQAANLVASQNQATVCDTGETLAADGVTCVSAATNWALWGGIALVGLFGLVALAGGSPRKAGR